MKLFTVEELKKLKEGDQIYLKYMDLPASSESDRFEGQCEVIVNNDEVLTTNKGFNINYSEFNEELASINKDDKVIQVYKSETSGYLTS